MQSMAAVQNSSRTQGNTMAVNNVTSPLKKIISVQEFNQTSDYETNESSKQRESESCSILNKKLSSSKPKFTYCRQISKLGLTKKFKMEFSEHSKKESDHFMLCNTQDITKLYATRLKQGASHAIMELQKTNEELFGIRDKPMTQLEPLVIVPKIPEITLLPEWKKTENLELGPTPEQTVRLTTAETKKQQTNKTKKILDNRNALWISSERLAELRYKVEVAVKNHKVFSIRGGFHSLRKALVARGWIEKYESKQPKVYTNSVTVEDLTEDLPVRKPGESLMMHTSKCEKVIMSKFLQRSNANFFWLLRREKIDPCFRNMMASRFLYVPFTNKEGLCLALREMQWYYEDGVSNTLFPRCYNVWCPEEFEDFADDFHLTACVSLLKWLVNKITLKGEDNICSHDGKVPFAALQFALRRCEDFVEHKKHVDIDSRLPASKTLDIEWETFLTYHYLLTHKNEYIQEDNSWSIGVVHAASRNTLVSMKKFLPQHYIDGWLNIWIVKPGNKCRGRGIKLMHNLKEIATQVEYPLVSKAKYVVQKYIERPLLIYQTKFDIRQWFLVTCVQPLTIWMYKESYLRFSSQQYDIFNYHESVHLTNHAVQCKYKNSTRTNLLPDDNMWDCHTFQSYLNQMGQNDKWENRIYPGMKEAIIGVLLSSQDNMDRRPNTFELFGADFMIAEDYTPWLLEINSSPDMAHTTSVTARLCPKCLEDVVKVLVDHRDDPRAETGSFELIYLQRTTRIPAYLGQHLYLRGRTMFKRTNKTSSSKSSLTLVNSVTTQNNSVTQVKSKQEPIVKQTENYNGPIIGDFIEYLQSSKSEIETSPKTESDLTGITFEKPVECEKKPKKKKSVCKVFLYNNKSNNNNNNIISNNNNVNHSNRKKQPSLRAEKSVSVNVENDSKQEHYSRSKIATCPEYRNSSIREGFGGRTKSSIEINRLKVMLNKYTIGTLWEQQTASILSQERQFPQSRNQKLLKVKTTSTSTSTRKSARCELLSKTKPMMDYNSLLAVGLGLKKQLRSKCKVK